MWPFLQNKNCQKKKLLSLETYPLSYFEKSSLSMYKSLSRKKYSQASYYSKFFLLIQLAGPGLSKDASDSFFESLVKVLLQEIPQYKHIFLKRSHFSHHFPHVVGVVSLCIEYDIMALFQLGNY